MIIYHAGLGFPLLDECSEVDIDSVRCIPNDEEDERRFDERLTITKSHHGILKSVYFHVMNEDEKCVRLNFNLKLGYIWVGTYIKCNLNELPYLNERKKMNESEYMLGFEPSNCRTLGRIHKRMSDMLSYIEPGVTRNIYLEFGVFKNMD